MNADGSNLQKLTENFVYEDNIPSWSPDGTKIAFAGVIQIGFERKFEVYVMNANGTNQQRLTTSNFDLGTISPSWSPDGTKIAFVSPSLVRDFEIHLMNSDGSNQKKLATIGFDADFSWSPDGTKIVFTTTSDVFIMNADGTIFKNLTNDLDFSDANREPSWSPDGTKIIFVRKNRRLLQSLGVYVMNVNGTNKQKLTDLVGTQPSWSP